MRNFIRTNQKIRYTWFGYIENSVIDTSIIIQKVSPVRRGKTNDVSAVVRSVNQSAPPVLKDATFSVMLLIWKQELLEMNYEKKHMHKQIMKY